MNNPSPLFTETNPKAADGQMWPRLIRIETERNPMTTLTNLGWTNAGGETYQAIESAKAACPHPRRTINEGSYGTVHRTECQECGWCYYEDSGD